jgi:hypothetical protein
MLTGIAQNGVLHPAAQALRDDPTHAVHSIRLCRTLMIRKGERRKLHRAPRDWVVVIDPKLIARHVSPLVDRLAHMRRLPDKNQGRHPPPKPLEVLEQFGSEPISTRASAESPKAKHRPHR